MNPGLHTEPVVHLPWTQAKIKNHPYGDNCRYQRGTICQERAGCSGCCISERNN